MAQKEEKIGHDDDQPQGEMQHPKQNLKRQALEKCLSNHAADGVACPCVIWKERKAGISRGSEGGRAGREGGRTKSQHHVFSTLHCCCCCCLIEC